MNVSYVSYFNLIAPITTLLLGFLLVACWCFIRSQKELLWISAGYILPAVLLIAQSGIDNDALARWTFLTTPIYIFGAWCIGHGLALRYHARSYPRLLIAVIVVCTSLLLYFSRIEPNLWLRIIILNSGILVAQVIALPSILRSKAILSAWDRALLSSFMLFSLLIFCRIVVTASADPSTRDGLLTESPYWRFLLISSLFFGLWFAVILLATTIAKIVSKLTYDRDHDPLTGLLNRRAFFEQAQKLLRQQNSGPCAILSFDIDHFKSVNDTFGHTTGDAVLAQVSSRLKQCTAPGYVLARFGGEEFIVLMPDTLPQEAKAAAENIQANLSTLELINGPKSITASFGLASIRSLEGLEEALKLADRALYRAKQNGRDQIQVAANEIHTA
jgi:diguanylate cyclase (GGDEF)-like protein